MEKEKGSKNKYLKLLMVVALAVAGVGFTILMKGKAKPPTREEKHEKAVPVKVITVKPGKVVPRSSGYGPVVPAKTWSAVAEVEGKVTYLNPKAKKGALLEKGALLAKIDHRSYMLSLQEAEASLEATSAKIEELAQKEKNDSKKLIIQEASLKLAARELERQRSLKEKAAVSQSVVDNQEKVYLSQKNVVQDIENRLRLYPVETKLLLAQLAQNRAKVEDAQLKLGYIYITAPFDCRISQVNVEEKQFAPRGQVLLMLDGIEKAEVRSQFAQSGLIAVGGCNEATVLRPNGAKMMTGIRAVVRLSSGETKAEWPARFARIGDAFDESTRTVEVIVEVDKPYSKENRSAAGSALVKGMHCEVELFGKPLENKIVVPRSSIREGRLNVVDDKNRLVIREVKTGLAMKDFAVIEEGLSDGDRVVVSELVPAIDGMLLAPVEDEVLLNKLNLSAVGEGVE